MNCNFIFDNNKLDEKALLNYGFKVEKSEYILKRNLKDGNFYFIISIFNKNFNVKVYDISNNEEYIPFNIKSSTGAFVANMRDEINNIVNDIIQKCFINENVKIKVLNYVKEKYNTLPIFPWEDYPTYCTLNESKKNKWYGLIMNIPYKVLGIDKESSVDVINIKLESEKIKKLVDNKIFFPAYHMNKKYWITILLNSNVSFEKIIELIDESYKLVSKK